MPPKKKTPTPRAKALTTATYLTELRQMKGVERGDFALLSDDFAATSPVKEWIPTGSIALDRAIGGGWPVGRIVELAAWEGVGKSTLVDQSIAQCQAMGGITCLVDTEQARDPDYTKSLGVDPDKLIIQQAETVEKVFESIDHLLAIQEAHAKQLAKSGGKPPPMLIVWDSLGGTPTKKEHEGEAGDRVPADAARTVKKNFQRLTQRIANARVCLIFTNHFYQEIGPFATLKTYGGSGVRYFTSLRVWLTRKESIRMGSDVVGHCIEAKLKKTRVSKPKAPAVLGLIYGVGVYNAYTLFEWGKDHGAYEGHHWIDQRGAWSHLMLPDGTHETFQKGFMGFAEVLQRRPDIYAQLTAHYFAEEIDEKTPPVIANLGDDRPAEGDDEGNSEGGDQTEESREAEKAESSPEGEKAEGGSTTGVKPKRKPRAIAGVAASVPAEASKEGPKAKKKPGRKPRKPAA